MATPHEQIASVIELGQDWAGYRIHAELGRGPSSVVYLAQEVMLDRRVALKILVRAAPLQVAAHEPGSVANFDHPNVIPIYSVGDSSGLRYVAMRFADGGSLRDVLRREGTLSLERTAQLLSPIAAALDAAHQAGVGHRNVKPTNVLIDYASGTGEQVYLSDPGGTWHAAPGAALVGYLAPEQIEGGLVGHRADVYALGCVVYECLTGSPPTTEMGREGTARSGALSAQVSKVVSRALAKDPRDRYPSCGELVAALGAASTARSSVASQALGGRRLAVLVGGGLVLALLLSGVVFLVARGRFPNDAEAALLAQVPSSFRDDCVRGDGVEGAEAVLRCPVEAGVDEVTFAGFESRGMLRDTYDQVADAAGAQADTGECAIDAKAESAYLNAYLASPRVSGRVLCYLEDGASFLVWTDDESQTLMTATRAGSESTELHAWWATLLQGDAVFPTAAEETLVGRLPETDCQRAAPDAVATFPEATVAVRCQPDAAGVDTVWYHQFPDLQTMRRQYDQRASARGAPEDASCFDNPTGFLGQGPYGIDDVLLGELSCYTATDGDLVVEWTNEQALITARAIGRGQSAFDPGWRQSVLALAEGAQQIPPGLSALEQALLRRVPFGLRPGCESFGTLVTGAVAALFCYSAADDGAVVYQQFPDQAAMRKYYDALVPVYGPPPDQSADCTQSPPGFVGEAEYQRNGQVSGRLLCYIDDDGEPTLLWTHNESAVLSNSIGSGTDTNALLAFWGVSGPR